MNSDAFGRKTRRRRSGLIRLLAACLLPALGATAVAAQNLRLEASPNPAAVYQKVALSVVVPADDPSAVIVSFPESSADVHVVSGPYIQPYRDNARPEVPLVRVSYVIEGNEPGRTIIPPLSISNGKIVEQTAPFVMAFGVMHGNDLVVPFQPAWTLPTERNGTDFYAGEAIPVVLVLRNEPREVKPEDLQLSDLPSGLERTSEPAESLSTLAGGTTLYQIPVASFLLMTSGPETVTLPAARVSAGRRSGIAIPRELQVKPAPEAIAGSGAIGAFAFRTWTTQQKVADGEEVSLHLRVEGTGNLPRIVMPVPDAVGLLQIDRNEARNIFAGRRGYSGFRETVYRYLLQGTSAANLPPAITVPAFSWLDPKNGSVESIPERTYPVSPLENGGQQGTSTVRETAAGASAAGGANVKGPPASGDHAVKGGASGAAGVLPPLPYAIESAAAIRSSEYHELYTRGDTYLWLLPGPVVFGLFLLVRPRRGKGAGALSAMLFAVVLVSCTSTTIHDTVQTAVAAYESGKLEAAASNFEKAASLYPHDAALSFDRGIVEYRLGRYGEAIHFLRAAIYYAPLHPTYRAALGWMVAQIGVPEQVPPAYPVHPDVFLLALIVAINASSILGILVLLRRSGGLAIALILLLVVSVISAGGLGYTAVKRSVQTAVVRSSGTEMTKIPLASAGQWLELPAGMAVRIRDSADGYYLVETAYGNRGWVKHDRVLVDAKPLQTR